MKIANTISATIAVLAIALASGPIQPVMAADSIDLGMSSNYVVLAGTTITNTGATIVNGGLGLSPGSSVTGFPPAKLNGARNVDDVSAVQAKGDLVAAYEQAAGLTPATTLPTELGGTTVAPGVYDSLSGTFEITGVLRLDGKNDPNAIFVFKSASTLVTATASEVVLTNGAQASNVFWQVGSSATLGTYSTLKGNILALTSITVTTGVRVEGKVFARNGAVTLDTNYITKAMPVPQFPDTGTPSDATSTSNIPWNIIIPVGIAAALLAFFLGNHSKPQSSNLNPPQN